MGKNRVKETIGLMIESMYILSIWIVPLIYLNTMIGAKTDMWRDIMVYMLYTLPHLLYIGVSGENIKKKQCTISKINYSDDHLAHNKQ